MNLNKGQPQSPGAECQLQTADCCLQTAISRLPDISKAAPICIRGDGVVLASLPTRGLQKVVAQPPSNITVTDYNSKIHMSKIYNEQK